MIPRAAQVHVLCRDVSRYDLHACEDWTAAQPKTKLLWFAREGAMVMGIAPFNPEDPGDLTCTRSGPVGSALSHNTRPPGLERLAHAPRDTTAFPHREQCQRID